MLVTGGDCDVCPPSADHETLRSAELYDPATETWSITGALNTAREWHTATLLPNGKVLIAGGGRGNDTLALSSAELYGSPPGIVRSVNLADMAALPDGAFHLAFTNTPGQSFSVLGSSDVGAPRGNWTMRGAVIEFWPGQYHFTDPQPASDSHRFYRVVRPSP